MTNIVLLLLFGKDIYLYIVFIQSFRAEKATPILKTSVNLVCVQTLLCDFVTYSVSKVCATAAVFVYACSQKSGENR